ncbi:MAG: hypothetical protein J1F36_03195 [Clostridiales bacterium]|nr:hypothetical protein [Clostridiales bacterium]
MDYGKLAYLKAIDLEDRFNISKSGGFSVSVLEQNNIPSGSSSIAEIEGSGDIAVFINCTDSATFYVDGVKICDGSNVFFKLIGGGKISAQSDGIEKLRLLALGNVVSYERAGYGYADYNGSTIGYLLCEQGKAKAYTATVTNFKPTKIFEGDFTQGDISAFGSGFIMAFVDSNGNIVTVMDGKRHIYSVGAQRVAINADSVITIAYVKNGELFYFALNGFGEEIAAIDRINYNGYIDDVRFIKKSGKLLFSSGGKCYIKELFESNSYDNKLYVNLTAEVL